MKKYLITVAIVAFVFAPTLAQNDSEFTQDVRELLVVTKTGDLGLQVLDQMMNSFQAAAPQAPEEFWIRMKNEIDANALVDLIVPIYAQHFTHEEIKALIAFYQTPAGKKVIEKMPLIMQESMVVGQQWGMELGAKIEAELKREGHI